MSLSHPSEQTARILYFHTGTHKTGSTALQTYLSANNDRLAKIGISYLFPNIADKNLPKGSGIGIGNGHDLYMQLSKRSLPTEVLRELLSAYFAGRPTAVCSSENFSSFGLDEWRQIEAACRQLGVQVRSITFLRDIAPYYLSFYRQLVKTGDTRKSFAEYCQSGPTVDPVASLKCLLQVFGRESMSVFHYNTVIDQIEATFMTAIGVCYEGHDFAAVDRNINRSLTDYELAILNKLNQATGDQYSVELSTLLMNRNPHLSTSMQIDEPILHMLRQRHADDVAWLNRTFFGDRDIIKVIDESHGHTETTELNNREKQAIDQAVANWCITRMQSTKEDIMASTVKRLSAIDRENASHPAVPADFDPYAYLLLNLDVFQSGTPPYQHFIKCGRHEHRRWQWPKQ